MLLYRFESLKYLDGLLHAVTKKSQGAPYHFSLALHTGEEQKKIIENREKIALLLSSKNDLHFVVAKQTHSDHIKVLTRTETKGWNTMEDAIDDCDALITAEKGVILTILTADCVPILLYDPVKEVVAAVHAGWKGTQAQIVAKTVIKMKEQFDCHEDNIVAAVGPSIGKCCYEVGEEVAKHFFDIPHAFIQKGEKYMLDLPYINKYQLLDAGLKETNIEMSNVCTACEVEDYFSYRKEQGCSGRFMSMIGMD